VGLFQDIKLLVQRPTIVSATATGLWNTGVATSLNPGADLFTFGTADQWWQITDAYLWLFPGVWNPLATITVRCYMNLMGVETEVSSADWDADGTDGQIAFIYWFFIAYSVLGPLRIEVYSDTFGDDGVVVPYEFRYKYL
jgi:hypothetical protein